MLKVKIPGCLTSLLILLILVILVKELWPVFVGIAAITVIIYYINRLKNIFKNIQGNKAKFEPQNGEVYKICPYCDAKAKATAMTCPHCNKKLN